MPTIFLLLRLLCFVTTTLADVGINDKQTSSRAQQLQSCRRRTPGTPSDIIKPFLEEEKEDEDAELDSAIVFSDGSLRNFLSRKHSRRHPGAHMATHVGSALEPILLSNLPQSEQVESDFLKSWWINRFWLLLLASICLFFVVREICNGEARSLFFDKPGKLTPNSDELELALTQGHGNASSCGACDRKTENVACGVTCEQNTSIDADCDANSHGFDRNLGPGRLLMLYASPLCYVNRAKRPVAVPQLPFEDEWRVLVDAHREARKALRMNRQILRRKRRCAPLWSVALLSAKPLTICSLQSAVASIIPNNIRILHISAHGMNDYLMLDDGNASAHFLDCESLDAMMRLRHQLGCNVEACLRVVFLNCCDALAFGNRMVQWGIPHVVCASGELPDAASHVFLRAFYEILFAGGSVFCAFSAGVVAVRNAPETSLQDSWRNFLLLPQGGVHDEVLFQPTKGNYRRCDSESLAADSASLADDMCDDGCAGSSGSSSDACQHAQGQEVDKTNSRKAMDSYAKRSRCRTQVHASRVNSRSPFGCRIPPLPEDFLGRELDAWTILQTLRYRRLLVLCGGSKTDHGIGKSAVLNAIRKTFVRNMGGTCVAVCFSKHVVAEPWIEIVHAAVKEQRERFSKTATRTQLRKSGHMNERVKAESTSLSPTPLSPDATILSELEELARVSTSHSFDYVLLLFDECDYLAEQEEFRKFLALILSQCPSYRVIVGTHQKMSSNELSQVKAVHYELEGLSPLQSARLFLRRLRRPLRWEELRDKRGGIVEVSKDNESDILKLVADHPVVAKHHGNPSRLIQVASLVDSSLRSLDELV